MSKMENTSITKVSKGWNVKTVEQVFDFYPTATYSRDKQVPKVSSELSIKYIHYGDIHTQYKMLLDATNTKIPYISRELKKDFEFVKNGDLIIADTSEDYDGVGKCVEVVNIGDNEIISGLHTLMLRQKGNDFIEGFKGYFFSSDFVRRELLRIVTGIKVYSITKATLAKVNLTIPSPQEQKAMMRFFSKVDEAIASVQNSITAAERLKKSLMQNLLTGKVKPDGTFRTSEEFYIDEKFGKVPVGWEVKKVQELSIQVTDGEHQTPERTETGYYLLSARNIKNGYLSLDDVDYISDKELRRIQKRCNPQGGDILISCSGTIGNVCIVPDGFIGGMVRSAALVKLNSDKIEPQFAELMLQSHSLQNQMKVAVASSVQGNIFQGAIKKLRLFYPHDKQERIAITERLCLFNKEIASMQDKLIVFDRLKKSLMQNLLTGKVIVRSK